MKSSTPISRPRVYFCYARPVGFSGQKEATELVMRGLRTRGWDCRALPQPVLDRDSGQGWALPRFGFGLILGWLRAWQLVWSGDARLCLNLGLTPVAFVRDAVPLLLGRLALGREQIVLSLHGSLFTAWPAASWRARIFVFLLRQGGIVTVLGEQHRRCLIALGVEPARAVVVINSCALPPLTAEELRAKWTGASDPDRPLQVLHLSSLIASKGFPEYLEALAELSGRPGPAVDAVLCGKVTASEFQDRFADATAAASWIDETVARINRSAHVKVRWVRGAVGAEKLALFRNADVFVLPTRYAVEAQPLVLLEAMAAGCAIITTRVGEISTILDEASATFLGAGSTLELVAALGQAREARAEFARQAEAAHRRFTGQYDLDHHLDGWEARFAPGRPVVPFQPSAARSKS